MNILIAILMLNLLIGVHELGHFLAAKASRVDVDEFSLGMGPKIFSKDFKGTTYSLRWILIGGYVRLNEKGYLKAKWWKQAIILFAGVIFNFIFAVIGTWIYIWLSDAINVGFFTSLVLGFQLSVSMVQQIFVAVIDIFKTVDTSAFAGPVGVVETISTFVNNGLLNAVEIFTVLNINLFVMNLLPIPMLDGGQIVLIIIKRVFKKNEMPKFETVWNCIGLAILGFILFIALKNDIVRILF